MPKEKRKFSLIGTSTSEKVRNIVGLLIVLGVVGSRFVEVKADHVSTVAVSSSEHGLPSAAALQDALRSFRVSEAAQATMASAVQRTVQEVQDKVAISFALGQAPSPSVLVECKSEWPRDKVDAICAAVGAELKAHLRAFKP